MTSQSRGRGFIFLLEFIADVFVVLLRVAEIIVRSGGQQSRKWAALEDLRARLDLKTSSLLQNRHDLTRRIPSAVFKELAEVRHQQIMMRKDIEDLLKHKQVDSERAYRAAGATVLLEAAVLLQRVGLVCADLAALRGEDHIDDQEAARDIKIANGDLSLAQSCCEEVKRKYLSPLGSRSMRRRRAARKLFYLLTFKMSRALERDSGITDVRQELKNLQTGVLDLQLSAKSFGSEYLTSALKLAVENYTNTDDATLTRRIIQIVEFADLDRSTPRDENYPVLILRIFAIRTRFAQLPATRWSSGWIAHLAILQSWLYLFVLRHARAKKELSLVDQFLRQATLMNGLAADQLSKYDALGRGLEPIFAPFSAAGRQWRIAEFADPPPGDRLKELLDEVENRTNIEFSQS